MKSFFTSLAAAAFLAAGGLFSAAQAATVDAVNSASFHFDVSGLGETTFSSFGYTCSVVCDDANDEGRLLSGASFTLDFGTTLGGSDIGTSSFTNPFSFAISNVSSGLNPNQLVPASVDDLFVTFNFVDDAFEVTSASISGANGNLQGTFAGAVPVAPVPLPAAAFLMIGALGGMRFASRRAKTAAA